MSRDRRGRFERPRAPTNSGRERIPERRCQRSRRWSPGPTNAFPHTPDATPGLAGRVIPERQPADRTPPASSSAIQGSRDHVLVDTDRVPATDAVGEPTSVRVTAPVPCTLPGCAPCSPPGGSSASSGYKPGERGSKGVVQGVDRPVPSPTATMRFDPPRRVFTVASLTTLPSRRCSTMVRQD